jgi:hypothetical protein
MSELRRGTRHRQRFPVTVGGMTGFTVNVGAGGFCTELLRVLTPGATVEGAIRVRNREYAYAGRVAWAHEGSRALNMRARMGVRFLSVEPEFHGLLGALAAPHAAPPPPRASDGTAGRKR